QIGQTDILMIPVGSVYTIDAKAASEIVSQLEPKMVIPMHYKIEGLKFELEGVENFLKEMGAENVVPLPKLSITKDKLPEEPQVILLAKSS
ncbi:MAG: MBL fold metallo-hydrolase, partial [Candidatus Daviesbacteria bacterium]|nr:MBL fold metallo-hydrolase [Candidatus Daviesbacteria bacterium]